MKKSVSGRGVLMNKRGAKEKGAFHMVGHIMWTSLAFLIVGVGVWLLSGALGGGYYQDVIGTTLSEAVFDTTGYGATLHESLSFLDFVFGEVPNYLLGWLGWPDAGAGISASIIVIGIWVLMFLIFGDIVSMFGTFNTTVAWLVALVAVVIAANVKVIAFFAVFGLVLFAGLGTLAFALNLVLVVAVFFAFNYGTNTFRDWALERRVGQLKMRTTIGRAKAREGYKALAGIGEEASSAGKP
jgi:hypothetical protein